ncbi:p53-like transcription factor [Gigaspora margarita]|uniref:p53-like transcription factor n=1 Tax=Gigaspora margarita TaxID=4874 RepID=A0A8H4APW1_GIGMA|nr:p53-like transcription factor [Gigaspora margarita]
MNISEEKWSIQQSQVPPSPHHPHSVMSPQMSGMPMQPFPYDGPAAQGQLHSQIYVPIATQTPSTPRPTSSPSNTNTSNPASDRKVIDNRPTFTTTSFHTTPFQAGAVRKRRTDTLGFSQDVGPFFSPTQQHHNIYSTDRTLSYKLRINSKVDRGFFLADNDWTCYRRNYFQISSAFSILSTTHHTMNESDIPCLLEVDGQFHNISQFLLGITARVSNSDKKIELVQHTPKRDKGPQMVPVPKPIRPGGNLNLSSVGSNSNIVTFERIQFKTATANNGKRRAAQQYYVVMVDLYAQTENGEQIRVATSTSAPLVVRGRSPGHYADNHDRYNPMSMNPAFPNDRHMGFPHPQGPGGAPIMTQDFGGASFPGPYNQYPPFPGFPPVNGGPMRNDALLMMPNGQAPQFHPQHPHQQYMVQGISEGENPNPDMYSNANMDSNVVNNSHNQKMHDIHMEGVTTASAPHSAFSNFESLQIQTPGTGPNAAPEYEGFHMYHNDNHPTSNTSAHEGYNSDNEHHSNGLNHMNGRQTRQDSSSEHNNSSQINGDKSGHDSKITNGNNNNTNYRIGKTENTDKL